MATITSGWRHGRGLDTLLGPVRPPISRLAGAQAGLVRTLSDDGEQLRLVGEIGLPPEVRLAELTVGRHCGTCGIAADNDALTWAADLHTCARQNKGGDYFGQHAKRMLAVPLRHREQLLGVYNLFFDTDAEPGADLLPVLRSIGELLGLALHHARLERQNLRATVMTERKFLASEVHDTIAQTLVYVNMRLPLLHDAMLQHAEQFSLKYFSDVEQAVGSVHANLREILTNLRASMDPRGLLYALRGLGEEFTKRTGIALDCACQESDLGLSVEQEVQILHIVQEALANISRHSTARRARASSQPRGATRGQPGWGTERGRAGDASQRRASASAVAGRRRCAQDRARNADRSERCASAPHRAALQSRLRAGATRTERRRHRHAPGSDGAWLVGYAPCAAGRGSPQCAWAGGFQGADRPRPRCEV